MTAAGAIAVHDVLKYGVNKVMRSKLLNVTSTSRRISAGFSSAVLLCAGVITGYAQAPADPHAQHQAADSAGQSNQQMANQLAELRAQVAKLQAALQAGSGNKAVANPAMPMGGAGKTKSMGPMGMPPPAAQAMPSGGPGMGMGMGMMGDKGEMGAMAPRGKAAAMPPSGGMGMMDGMMEMGDKAGMGGMPAGGKGMAAAPEMGMCCMGGMGGATPQPGSGMAAMSPPSSAMPGQPGASHLYHIGSTGFFLNHSQHITLTGNQRLSLNRLKEKAVLERASEQRRIDQSEQELYSLTGADQLDNPRVQAKISEIEKLRGEQRMNFIRAVGEATNVLTHEQHLALMGTMAGK